MNPKKLHPILARESQPASASLPAASSKPASAPGATGKPGPLPPQPVAALASFIVEEATLDTVPFARVTYKRA
jgi:hypothetical protein